MKSSFSFCPVLAIFFIQANAAYLPKIQHFDELNLTKEMENVSFHPKEFSNGLLLILLDMELDSLYTVAAVTNGIMNETQGTEIINKSPSNNRCLKKTIKKIDGLNYQVKVENHMCTKQRMDDLNEINDHSLPHELVSILKTHEACIDEKMKTFQQSLMNIKEWFNRCSNYQDRSFTEEMNNFFRKSTSWPRLRVDVP